MSRHGTYYAQRPVPCECGSHDVCWRDCGSGARLYLCTPCFKAHKKKCSRRHEESLYPDDE